MSRILVIYGTTDGHTAKIASAVARTLRAAGADAEVADAAAPGPPPRADAFDAVVVAASVHISAYQRAVRRWVRANAAALGGRPTAFLSVCLGMLEHKPEADRALAAIVERFLARTGWRPTVVKQVAGAVPYTRYNRLKRWVMRRIARRAGGDTDTTRDFEYTDWPDLEAFARDFHRRLAVVGPGGDLRPPPAGAT